MPVKLSEIRAKYPMYDSLSDDDFLIQAHKNLYPTIPAAQFFSAIDRDTERAKLNPAEGMGALERGLVGAGAAARKAYLGVRNLIPGQNLSEDEKNELGTYEQNRANLGTAGTVGEIGAEMAMTALPLGAAQRAARFLPQAVTAARGAAPAGRVAMSAATSAAIAPEERGSAALGGAIGGAAGEAGGRVLGRVLGGLSGSTQAARELAAEGINVPLWKATDQPWLRRLGESAKALPFAGPALRRAEGHAMRDYNRTLVRGATPPRPELDEAGNVLRWTMPEQAPVRGIGQEGARELGDRFSDAYDSLYRARGGIPIDDTYRNAVQQELASARAYLPRAADDIAGAARRADDTLRRGTETTVERSPIVNQQGQPFTHERLGHEVVPSGNVQAALQEMDDAIRAAWNRGDSEAADILTNLREQMSNLRTRGLPPESQGMQADVNRAYQRYKTLQRAGSSMGAMTHEGIVTPRQMINSIRARDTSPNKKLSFEGRAPGQQAAQRANDVLGSELPDVGPGTAEKIMPWLMYSGGIGLPAMGLDSGALLLLGTPQGQRFLRGDYRAQALMRRAQPSFTDWMRTFGTAAGS